jgi:hypothetical protein
MKPLVVVENPSRWPFNLDEVEVVSARAYLTEHEHLERRGFVVDYVVLGGGNTKRIEKLPPKTKRGSNANAFAGGFRLWSGTAKP